MPNYHFEINGFARGGQTYSTSGDIATERAGDFALATSEALRRSFDQLTDGTAVYGNPGTCQGPYTICELRLTLMPDSIMSAIVRQINESK